MDNIKKTLCKSKAKTGPLSFLETSCPAEAKAYRELQRKQEDCEGRGFTSGAKMKKCMGGETLEDEDTKPASSKKAKPDAESDKSDSGVNSDTVLEGAKKLKGLFGF